MAVVIPAAVGALFALLSSVVFSHFYQRRQSRRVSATAIAADSERIIDWAAISLRGYLRALEDVALEQPVRLGAVDLLFCPSVDITIGRCDTITEIHVLAHAFRAHNLISELNADVATINAYLEDNNT